MRTVPFREVLHGVAYKMGLDPDQSNFLTNQAIPIGTYIDEWVRRTYDIRDWPEWVVTHKFVPNASHIVAWDATAADLVSASLPLGTPVQFGRVLKVYLVDPSTTNAPVDTPFTLKDEGIHVGYEHGTYVWIKFMAPPPRYTAVQWRADNVFAKDDVTYSYTTGQVYKSKANGNIGHDPAGTFSVPPIPHLIEPQPPAPSPDITTTQPWVPDNVGLSPRSQIVVIDFNQAIDGTPIPDPMPTSGMVVSFNVNYGGVTPALANAPVAGTPLSIADAIDDMVADLVAYVELSSFTITANHANKTITIENLSNFSIETAIYREGTDGPNHFLKVTQTQSYIPEISSASGQRQITRIAMTDEATVPGSVYTLTVTGSDSVDHSVSYTSQLYDSGAQILFGLINEIAAAQLLSIDPFWEGVQLVLDPDAVTLDISINQGFSVDATAPPPGSSWWELVPFPRAIADQVMTGALGDLLNEWGQFDKGAMVQQGVPAEAEISATDFMPTHNPPLSSQQKPMSRYQLQ